MEYKNVAVPGETKPSVFLNKVKDMSFWKKIAQKFYGTFEVVTLKEWHQLYPKYPIHYKNHNA